MTYYFGHLKKDIPFDYLLDANTDGDIIVNATSFERTRVVNLDWYSGKKYDFFEKILSAVLSLYHSDTVVYITDAGRDAINRKVFQNRRNKIAA